MEPFCSERLQTKLSQKARVNISAQPIMQWFLLLASFGVNTEAQQTTTRPLHL